jgi:hypothetical protein
MSNLKVLLILIFWFYQSISFSILHKYIGLNSISRFSLGMKLKVSDILKNPVWPKTWPFTTKDFLREDETVDTNFYYQPRLVYHIDDFAVESLSKFYKSEFKPNSAVLDVCSSWVSHYPPNFAFSRAVGIGMNDYELSKNIQLSEYYVRDLNSNPTFLPLQDNSFDYVTLVVSVDYLTKPLEVFKEINRVLKPGGKAIISQSNRCFPTKAINIWLNTNDFEHVFIVGSYFHYATGFENLEAIDISPNPGRSDPLFIIQATKKVD